MYRKTHLKLTVVYSLLFFLASLLLSLGLYNLFKISLGESYILEVEKQRLSLYPSQQFMEEAAEGVIIAGNVALAQLRELLIIINALLIAVVPPIAWYLTGQTLNPLKFAYDKQRGFVSDASHELKTPLSILSGEMELALKKPRSVEEYESLVKSSKEEIDRLSQLTKNLLFLAKMDYQKNLPERKMVDLPDVIQSVIIKLKPKSEIKNVRINFKFPAKNLAVFGNEGMLWTLLFNLIDNAINYTPPKGRVWVDIEKSGRFAKITVKDTGVGIEGENLKKIFDRFHRIDSSRPKAKGFGLGLSIAKSIVDRHNGKIAVDSEIGKGSTFSIYLPLGFSQRPFLL